MASENKSYWQDLEAVTELGPREQETPESDVGWSRRSFLQASGFGAAAVLAACGEAPVRQAIPLLVPHEQVKPGLTRTFASSCQGCTAGCGLLVRNRDGRPIKLEGFRGRDGDDRSHPLSAGGLCAVGQATLLGLYDELRPRGPRVAGKDSNWAALDSKVLTAIAAARETGRRIVVLTETLTGPTTRARLDQFLARHQGAGHLQYDSLSVSALLDAHEMAFGLRVLPRLRFAEAEVIVSFDCDFLGAWFSPVEHAAGWQARRKPSLDRPEMSWHVQIEARMSLTGSKADRRVVARNAEADDLLDDLLASIGARQSGAGAREGEGELVAELADRLIAAQGRGLVVSGRNELGHQLRIARLNDLLGHYGQTLDIAQPSLQRAGDDRVIPELLASMKRGEVGLLIVRGLNPVYDLPEGGDFAAALEQVGLVVSVGVELDETAVRAGALAPEPHFLERHDDLMPVAGLLTLGQPVIAPLFDSRSFRESLATWAGETDADADFRRTTLAALAPQLGSPKGMNRALHEGFVLIETPERFPAAFKVSALPPKRQTDEAPALEVLLYHEPARMDGRHAHNAWLQELPDPITKTTWGNALLVAPGRAGRLDLESGDLVKLQAQGLGLMLPVLIQVGQHEDVVAVALGHGRAGTDRFHDQGPDWLEGEVTVKKGGVVGTRVAQLARRRDGRVLLDVEASISPAKGRVELARVQSWDSIDLPPEMAPGGVRRRPVVTETTLAALAAGEKPHGAHHGDVDLWPDDHANERPSWGMEIDLSRCTGCSACMIACQVENNVPVVGRDEVVRHREMHWIRIDRYYSGDPAKAASVEVIHQPMMCHHCDNAPCETVCPVLATVHGSEGLNQQVYNRCVGTRYCANNCPYKVRRFNWFDYAHEDRLQNMALNPDITVRSRGVMEKCSLCVQRIQEAKAAARRDGRDLRDADIQPACMQTCPTTAIVFGNLKNRDSAVATARRDPLHFEVLGELNLKAGVGYRSLVRNKEATKDERHG